MIKLSERTIEKINNDNELEYTNEKAYKLKLFLKRINNELLNHEVIINNKFIKLWAKNILTKKDITNFIIQFSVFSNQFLIAQLQKVINSDTLEAARESKEILANEIGVIFKSKRKLDELYNNDIDSNLVSTKGSVDGGTYRFSAAHFEWIYKIAKKLDLKYNDIGRRCHGYKSTLYFCDKLIQLYGGSNYNIALACSYAIENWAAAGFWKELIHGLKKYNSTTDDKLPLSFFIWHDKIEDQHAEHTQEELEEIYFTKKINEDEFIEYGNKMLDAVLVFWDGML